RVGANLGLPSGAQPAGTLRFGKSSFDPAPDAGGEQFYGLLDDVAVFTAALSDQPVAALAASQHLSGGEANLLVGDVFGYLPPGGLPPTLARSVTPTPAAMIVPVSANRDSTADAALLPLALTSHQNLPFPPGQNWFVIQGFDNAAGSHRGYASFCLDLMLAGR